MQLISSFEVPAGEPNMIRFGFKALIFLLQPAEPPRERAKREIGFENG